MRCFKTQISLKVIFRRETENGGTKCLPPIYFNFKPKTVTNDLDVDDSLETSNQTILS